MKGNINYSMQTKDTDFFFFLEKIKGSQLITRITTIPRKVTILQNKVHTFVLIVSDSVMCTNSQPE